MGKIQVFDAELPVQILTHGLWHGHVHRHFFLGGIEANATEEPIL